LGQQGAKQFLSDLVDNSQAGYEKSLGCNFPAYPKALPNLIVRLENDDRADPSSKYVQLKDALHWTPNLGAPGYVTPVWMEAFNTFLIPKMFARYMKEELSAEEAARAIETELKRIAERWKNV
jgi:multiple sugar transport system substrate-binding protein